MWWNDMWSVPWMLFGPVMMLAFIVLCATMMWLMMTRANDQGRLVRPNDRAFR